MATKVRTKEDLYRLIDELPEGEVASAARYLEYLRNMGDPVLRALLEAPEDDEPETEEQRAAAAEARAEWKRGETRRLEDVRRELDL